MRSRKWVRVVVAVTMAVAFAACGDDGADEPEPPDEAQDADDDTEEGAPDEGDQDGDGEQVLAAGARCEDDTPGWAYDAANQVIEADLFAELSETRLNLDGDEFTVTFEHADELGEPAASAWWVLQGALDGAEYVSFVENSEMYFELFSAGEGGAVPQPGFEGVALWLRPPQERPPQEAPEGVAWSPETVQLESGEVTIDGSEVRFTASWEELQELGIELPFNWRASLSEMDMTQGPQTLAEDSCPDIDPEARFRVPADDMPRFEGPDPELDSS